MGIWRNDPQPVQLPPRVPASALTTGSQPPRNAVAGAIAMACILASWPAQGEPRPIQPIQGRSQIAPLTLVYGQQPPRIDPMPEVQARVAIASWPEDREPRLQFNNQQPERRYVVAQTLKYGSQPPVAGPLTTIELNIAVRSWDSPFQSPPQLEGTAGWNIPVAAAAQVPFARITVGWPTSDQYGQKSSQIAPLTLVYGDQPPVAGALSPAELGTFVRSWEPPRSEPPQLVKIAPLTLLYGQQPPVVGALSVTQLSIIGVESAWWPAQSENDNAGWNVPIAAQTFLPAARFQSHILVEAPWWNAQSENENAAWNVAVVSQPTPFTPQLHVGRSWDPPFLFPQELEFNAGWNVPAIVSPFIPNFKLQGQLLAAWRPADPRAPGWRNIVQPGAAVLIVETDALTGTVRIVPRLVGIVAVLAELSGTDQAVERFEGLVSSSPRLIGVVGVVPRLGGKIIIRPVS